MTLVLAMLLDAALGEPKWLWARMPHPAVLMGRLIGACDHRFNQGDNRRRNGLLVMAALALAACALGTVLASFGPLVEIVVAAVLLAQRSLVDHVQSVADALRLSQGDGRREVAKIVSRQTAAMDDPAIARAAIESAAENLSDGVIAPVFWFALFGLPGLLLYKITNTADSMIGYRNDRYLEFGWAAARFDDALNLIPARLTALLIALPYRQMTQWSAIAREARQHRSPNAGWPEAAMARAINVTLSGPRAYDGQMQVFPYVHPDGRDDPGAAEIDQAVHVLWRVWAIALGGALFAGLWGL